MNKYLNKLTNTSKIENIKYFKWYYNLILKALKRTRNKSELDFYSERHHILPKCLCTEAEEKNDIENTVLLSLKEHALAHKLLSKSIPSCHKLKRAYYGMFKARNDLQNKPRITSRDYEFFRKNAKEIFGRSGEENGMYGKKHTKETKNKISKKALGKKASNETKGKMRIANGKEKNPFFGKTHSEKTKTTIREKLKGKTTYIKCYILIDKDGTEHKLFTKERLIEFSSRVAISYRKIEEFLNKGIITPPKFQDMMNDKTKNTVGWSAVCKTIPIQELFSVL